MMTIGSLFSGVGGLELGLEMAGLGPVRWQVEINPHARAVLAAHWPEATRYENVCDVGGATLAPVQLVCGGFPCQDVSSAAGAKRLGLRGTRSGLWFEFRRIVAELRPPWVVVENVASGATAWFDAVAGGLVGLGYAVLPIPLSAADVGAPHERRRVFLVAYTDRQGEPAVAEHAKMAEASSDVADADGRFVRVEPGRRGRTGRTRTDVAAVDGGQWPITDALRPRPQGHRAESHALGQRHLSSGWRSPIPDVLRVADGLSSRLDAARPRIQALGNAVVPQCAEVVGHVIRQLMGDSI